MRTYGNHPTAIQWHVLWMMALFTIMTVLLSLLLVRPAH